MSDYVLKGYLTNAAAGTPLRGLRVECWDRIGPPEKDAYLAGGVSGPNGEFSIAFESTDVSGADAGRLPALYFKVFSGDSMVDTSEDTFLGGVTPGVHDVGVAVRLPQEVATRLGTGLARATGSTYKVPGRVASSGTPVAGVGVSVVGYRLPGEPTLAETKTGADGRFSVVLGHDGDDLLGADDEVGSYRFVVTFPDGSAQNVESSVTVGAEVELNVTAPPVAPAGSAETLEDIASTRFRKNSAEATAALALADEGISTLGDIRRAGSLSPDTAKLKGAKTFLALADLDAVIPDPSVSLQLVAAGIDSVDRLAAAPLSEVQDALQTGSADAVQVAALTYIAERDRLIVETMMAAAAGQALPDDVEADSDFARAVGASDSFPTLEGCMGAAGPVAYLAALTDLVTASVNRDGNRVTLQVLSEQMHLDVLNLPAACDALTQVTLQARLVAEGLAREAGSDPNLPEVLAEYARSAAYPAFLAELGTSYEELALARSAGSPPLATRRLAERLGLPGSSFLASLTLDPDERTPSALATLFGLQPILRTATAPLPTATLLVDRRTFLRRQWAVQDWGAGRDRVTFPVSEQAISALRASAPPPVMPVDERPRALVDPTVIGAEDIRPVTAAQATNPALALWSDRYSAASGFSTDVRAQVAGITQSTAEGRRTAFTGLLQTYLDLARAGNAAYPSWASLFDVVDAGRDVSVTAARLDLRPAELSLFAQAHRSLGAARLKGGVADAVVDAIAAVWTRRQTQGWREQELGLVLTLSPDFFQLSAGDDAGTRSALRSEQRRDWRRTLAARLEQDRGLEEALGQATLAAEAVALRTQIGSPALPLVGHLLRLAFPDDGANEARTELLIDADVDPAVRTTRLAHTTSVLQILLGQLREGYAVRGMTLPATEGREAFDALWQWHGTYDTWRAATGTQLFPENTALPYARPETTKAYQILVDSLTPPAAGSGTPDPDPLGTYLDYAEDLQSLIPMAGCRALVRDLPGGTEEASFTSHTFAFAWSWRAGGILWSATPDADHLGVPQRFLWTLLPKLPVPHPSLGAYHPIGAVPYELSGGPRYVCLFMQRGVDPTLLLYRFDLDTGEWVDSAEPDTPWLPVRIGQRFSSQPHGTQLQAVVMEGQTALVDAGEGKMESPNIYIAFHIGWDDSIIYRDRIILRGTSAPTAVPARFFHTEGFDIGRPIYSLAACGMLAPELPQGGAGDDIPNIYAVSVTGEADRTVGVRLHVGDTRTVSTAKTEVVENMVGWTPAAVAASFGSGCITVFTAIGGVIPQGAHTYIASMTPEFKTSTTDEPPSTPSGGVDLSPVLFGSPPNQTNAQPTLWYPMVHVRTAESVKGALRQDDSNNTPELSQTWLGAGNGGFVSVRMNRPAAVDSSPIVFREDRRLAPKYHGPLDRPVGPAKRLERQVVTGYAFLDGSYTNDTYLYLEEAFLAVPLLLAERARRDGRTAEALDWYGALYDDASASPYIYAPLNPALSFPARLVLNPLDPHRRLSVDKRALLAHVLMARGRVLLDAADTAFVEDTPEAVDRARGLYDQARRTLSDAGLGTPDAAARQATAAAVAVLKTAGGVPGLWWQAASQVVESLTSIPSIGRRTQAAGAVAAALQGSSGWPARIAVAAQAVAAAMADPQAPASVGELLDARQTALSDARQAIHQLPSASRHLDAVSRLVAPLVADVAGPVQGKTAVPSVSTSRSLLILARGFPPPVAFVPPPNPVLRGLRLRAQSNLGKIHQGRNIAGLERPLYVRETGVIVSGGAGVAVRRQPTPYRAATLLERARQIAQLAQQAEAAFLNALERLDSEGYAALQAAQQLELTDAAVTLQSLRFQEAFDGVALAAAQIDRAAFQSSHFERLSSEPVSRAERESIASLRQSMDLLERSRRYSQESNDFGLVAGLANGIAQAIANPTAAPFALLGAITGGASNRGAAYAQDSSTRASIQSARSSQLSQQASYERRAEEWALQGGLAQRDVLAARQGVALANDRVAVAGQEREIAALQALQARDTAIFLATKFTNVGLYQWMSAVLEDIFAFYIQLATSTARLALAQLSFERQTATPPIIATDYATATDDTGQDRRGLTGSARLLADITRLDQYAFETDRRALQLTTTVSLSQHDPAAFERFRQSGVLPFTFAMEAFDRDFPGHYLRLVRGVAVSVVALVPPTRGIRATLASTGLSTVIVEEDGTYRSVQLRRDPDLVAFTSPIAATGIITLEPESRARLQPFEGAGVDVGWELRMPRAANPFDYRSVADVLVTLEFSAFDSPVYREQVLSRLDPEVQLDRPFSLRDDAADAWYDLLNPLLKDVFTPFPSLPVEATSPLDESVRPADKDTPREEAFDVDPDNPESVLGVPIGIRVHAVTWKTTRDDFPPHLADLALQHVQFYAVRADGKTAEMPGVTLAFTPSGGASTPVFTDLTTHDGLLSTRRDAPGWPLGVSPIGTWSLALGQVARSLLESEQVEDILIVLSVEGVAPLWPS